MKNRAIKKTRQYLPLLNFKLLRDELLVYFIEERNIDETEQCSQRKGIVS
jgi:hypothetical protein